MATECTTREFEVSLDSEGLGTLLVTDLGLMLRPAVAGQYHRDSPHDEGRIAQIMNLGDTGDYNLEWHVVTDLPAAEAHRKMDRAWHAYFDGYCMGKVWIDANVTYIGPEGSTLLTHGYGFDDGEVNGTVYVYGREFWDWCGTGHPGLDSWSDLLREARLAEVAGPIPLARLGLSLASGLMADRGNDVDRLIVVIDAAGEPGYATRDFTLIDPNG